jgi:membrane glycosyltransferase
MTPEVAGALVPLPGMPPETPTAMPTQRLDEFNAASRRRFLREASRSRVWRRMVVFGLAAALAGFGSVEMAETLSAGAVTTLTLAVLALFTLNFAWIAFACVNALVGTVITIGRTWRRKTATSRVPLAGRTAMLMPIYNEQPERTFAAIEAMARGIARLGHSASFDWFILSDTTDATVALTGNRPISACAAA